MILPLILSTILNLNFPFVFANDAAEKVINISDGYTNVIRPGQSTIAFDVAPQITEKNMFTINLYFSNGENLVTDISIKKHTENQHKHH